MKHSEMTSARPFLSGLCLFCVGMLAAGAHAASITFAGAESGKTVENWSNPNPVIDETLGDLNDKTLDLNGDNRFGGAGYYQLMPAAIGTDNVGLPAAPGNDLGIMLNISGAPLGTLQTAGMTPDFLDGIPAGAAGDYINNTNFPNYSDASGTTELRQGSIWLSESNIQEEFLGDVSGNSNTAFIFTLSKPAEFRLGVAVDAIEFSDAAPDYVSIWNVNTGEFFSDLLTRDGTSDMVFFDIDGGVGDEFVVKLWSFDFTRTAFALITFDLLPNSDPTLSYVLNGNNITLSWQPEISGWTLESSTDLGVSDDWTAVTEPPVVNNSVTLDITGTPKNFFRLRKDP